MPLAFSSTMNARFLRKLVCATASLRASLYFRFRAACVFWDQNVKARSQPHPAARLYGVQAISLLSTGDFASCRCTAEFALLQRQHMEASWPPQHLELFEGAGNVV